MEPIASRSAVPSPEGQSIDSLKSNVICNRDDDPTFGVVIPTRNEERNIGRLLRSIQAQSCASHRTVIVDQHSSDGTTAIARSYGCLVVDVPPSDVYSPPALSRNLGARSIGGRILLHLDADMELGSSDFLEVLGRFIDARHECVVIPERDVASGFWARCKSLERSCYSGTEMEGARAVTRRLFDAVGGYDREISSGEDFFITRLYSMKTNVAHADSLVLLHYTGPYSLRRLARKKFDYGRSANQYLRKARAIGAGSAVAIVRASSVAYFRNWRLIWKHPIRYLCILPMRAIEFAAMQVGMRVEPKQIHASIRRSER